MKEKEKKDKKNRQKFGRGIDTVYRVTLRNHVNLSSMADSKANLLININTLIVSVIITAGSAGFSMTDLSLDKDYQYFLPVLILMLCSLFAIIFAVVAVYPRVSDKKINAESIRSHEASLMFFGNFIQLEKEEFVQEMKAMAHDEAAIYDDLSRDLYQLGKVLDKKYFFLKIANQIFVIGLILSALTFWGSCLFVY